MTDCVCKFVTRNTMKERYVGANGSRFVIISLASPTACLNFGVDSNRSSSMLDLSSVRDEPR